MIIKCSELLKSQSLFFFIGINGFVPNRSRLLLDIGNKTICPNRNFTERSAPAGFGQQCTVTVCRKLGEPHQSLTGSNFQNNPFYWQMTALIGSCAQTLSRCGEQSKPHHTERQVPHSQMSSLQSCISLISGFGCKKCFYSIDALHHQSSKPVLLSAFVQQENCREGF